jgi:hypothetical protein
VFAGDLGLYPAWPVEPMEDFIKFADLAAPWMIAFRLLVNSAVRVRAILSRSPIEIVSTTLLGDEADSHARFLEVMIDNIRYREYLPAEW